ncbi:MAG: ATP-dependent helicase HrpB [Flavobacteriales bacterium]|nr:ATP-dependent helicase HrpB [Flavobacteriales bacterium]
MPAKVPLDFEQIDLPIISCIPEIKKELNAGNTLLVQAAPGAGKSTVLPLALLHESWLEGKKILMLEPRRLAAKSIAARLADLIQESTGETVGYRIRFESRISSQTRLEVLTEGILTRKLQHDNALQDVGLVIFDEFHERSIHADLALALCREIQQVLRPDLRILVMSATLNSTELSGLLKAPVIQSEGRQYPVEIRYAPSPTDWLFLTESVTKTVSEALQAQTGDVLVFLPGEGEIKRCAEKLELLFPNVSIHPLYGKLNFSEQQRAILPHPQGKRKIVLATSIAETSLTIEGIRIVVDSGFMRSSRFDAKTGLTRLETTRVSKDSADQRAGRAGRLSAGVCYRLWTSADHSRLAEHRIPEIMEADLTPLCLDLAVWGVTDINGMAWLNTPPARALQYAHETLKQLGALDEDGKITPHGKEIHRLACHPRIAHMLIMAQKENSAALATDIAALLEEKDPMPDSGADVNIRLEALRRAREYGKTGGRFSRIEQVAESYRKLLSISMENTSFDPFTTGLLLAYAFPERIASARAGNNSRFQLANGQYATLPNTDDLAHEPWLSVAHVDSREGLGKIFLASPLNPKDLRHLVKEKENISWDNQKGGLVCSKDLLIGSIVLQSTPISNPDKKLIYKILISSVKTEGRSLLNFDEDMTQLQNRIESLSIWNADEAWPDVKTETLLVHPEEWLGPYIESVKRVDDFKKINLSEALLHHLPYEKQILLNELAPARIKVPSGSSLSLQYFADGSAPVLAVRLQEVFGMAETPRLNAGKTGIILHLLSPGYKPVQVTSDLRSFWNNTYFEVKKELKRRYPKHAWPEDPWTAAAVAKGRPTKN